VCQDPDQVEDRPQHVVAAGVVGAAVLGQGSTNLLADDLADFLADGGRQGLLIERHDRTWRGSDWLVPAAEEPSGPGKYGYSPLNFSKVCISGYSARPPAAAGQLSTLAF
jgi:hypothetical protein